MQTSFVVTCSRANVPCVLKCSRANVLCVLSYYSVLRAYLLTCQHSLSAYRSQVSTYLANLFTHVSTRIASSCPYVPTCLGSLGSLVSRDHLPAWLSCLVSRFDAAFFRFTVIAVKLHTLLVSVDNLIDVFAQ